MTDEYTTDPWGVPKRMTLKDRIAAQLVIPKRDVRTNKVLPWDQQPENVRLANPHMNPEVQA